jgi:hypothetical protein
MDDRGVSDFWKKAVMRRLYEGRPRPVDLSVSEMSVGLAESVLDEDELFEATVYELRRDGLIDYSMQTAPAGQVFDARLTPAGVLRYESTNPNAPGKDTPLIAAIARIRAILVSVSTGGARIQTLDGEYQELFAQVDDELRAMGLENSIPFNDLWKWYGRWSEGDLPSYQSRRQFVAELIDPLVTKIRTGRTAVQVAPTGWPLVDRQVGQARQRLAAAKKEEDFQTVGLLSRETLISLAQAVFDPARHPTEEGINVSETDYKRMIEAYIVIEMAGGQSEEIRKHAKSALDLANKVQHRRTATFRDAAICLEATASIVNIIAIVSGRRDPAP